MTYKNILTHQEAHVLRVTINRETKLNALNRETLSELHQVIREALENDDIWGLVLTGAGEKAFVAGADILEFSSFTKEEGFALAKTGQTQVFDLLYHAPKPIIAAINGYALGGGLELALACHLRVVSDTAKLGLPEVSLGLIPGYGGTQRLTQLVGRGQAMEMILTGDMITAEKALQIGLVNYIVPAEEVQDKASALLNQILKRSPAAVASAVKAINGAWAHAEEGFALEMKEFAKCFGTSDFKEGVKAFLEKRNPNFRNE